VHSPFVLRFISTGQKALVSSSLSCDDAICVFIVLLGFLFLRQVRVWDVSPTALDTVDIYGMTALHTIYTAGGARTLRWRPSALQTKVSRGGGGGGDGGTDVFSMLRACRRPAVSTSLSFEGDVGGEAADEYDNWDTAESGVHAWQLAVESNRKASVIEVWDVRSPFVPVAVLHPPAWNFFGQGETAAAASSTKAESVEFGTVEWLDSSVPRQLVLTPEEPTPPEEEPEKCALEP